MSSAEHREHVEYVCPYPRLKDKLDERFILRGLFDEYWRIRRAESSDSWLAQVYAELYDVAVKLYSFIASYQDKTGTCAPGSEDDPRVFWSLAQPLDASEARPGIIDVYARIITSDDFLHSPPALIDHILWGFGALFWMRHSWIRAPGRSEKKSVYSVIFSHTPNIWKCLWDNRSHIRARSQSARDAEGYGPESVDPCHEAFGNYPEPYSRLLEWYAYLYDGYIEFLKVCTPEERSLEPEYARYMDTFMPHVGLLVWASGNEQKTVAGKELAVQRLTTSLLDDMSTDSVILTAYKERIAREAVVEGIGAHTFFDRFETVMKQQHADTYKAPPMHCIQLVLSFAMTRSLSPYLADRDVLHPIVQMCNFYGRTMQRDFWDMTITFFMFVTEFVGGHVPDDYKDYVGTTHALVRGGDIIDFLARGIDCLAGWDLASEPAVDFDKVFYDVTFYITPR
ncbi:hypothetical protein PENSPDRAFT_689595 [Peniophora sp. CONT]|nr:hypothetical protein PENSPDRAFT_689595 [Peniophora sp. CONT]